MVKKCATCGICQNSINTKTDTFYYNKYFLKGKYKSDEYFHVQCWVDKFKGNQKNPEVEAINKKAFNILNIMEDRLGLKQNEVYNI